MTLESRLDDWSRSWRGPLLAALVALVAALPAVFAVPPLDRDESRFAQATAQMLESEDYVSINFQDQPRDKKPVGIHWLQAASVALLSDAADRDIWPYRVPSLLGAMLAAAACAWGASAFFGARTGLLAGAMLGASFLLSTEGAIAKTDAVMAGSTALALAAMGRIWFSHRGGPPVGRRTRLLFWLGIGLAILVKGPVGPVVALMAGLALWASERKIDWARSLGLSWGPLLVLAMVGPWAWAITVASDGTFWSTAIGEDMAPKLVGGHEEHGGLPGYHLLLSPMLTFPGCLLLPAGLIMAWKARTEPGVRFALCWLIPTWLAFELLPTKLAHYTLPGHAALFWLMAASLREPLTGWGRRGGMLTLGFASLVFAATCIFGLVRYGDRGDLIWAVISAGLFLATALVGGILIYRKSALTALVTAGSIGVLAHAVAFGQLAPRLEPLWLSQRIALALEATGLAPRAGVVAGPVQIAGYSEPSLIFALGTDTGLGGGAEAAKAVADGRPAVVERSAQPQFLAALKAAGLSPRPAGAISGVDYSNARDMTLTLYRGEPQPEPVQQRVEP